MTQQVTASENAYNQPISLKVGGSTPSMTTIKSTACGDAGLSIRGITSPCRDFFAPDDAVCDKSASHGSASVRKHAPEQCSGGAMLGLRLPIRVQEASSACARSADLLANASRNF